MTEIVAYCFIIGCVLYFSWFFGLIVKGCIKAYIEEKKELKRGLLTQEERDTAISKFKKEGRI